MGFFDFLRLKRRIKQDPQPAKASKHPDTDKKKDLLADLAKNNRNALIRRSATFGLNPHTHRSLLADLSKNDKHTDVRRVAKDKLENFKEKSNPLPPHPPPDDTAQKGSLISNYVQ